MGLAIAALLLLPVFAQEGPEWGCCVLKPPGPDFPDYESEEVTELAHEAISSLIKGNWTSAQKSYIQLIAVAPMIEDFYFGLYYTSKHLEKWDKANDALEGLFKLNPSLKDKLSFEFGESLFHVNRFVEAEEQLTKALTQLESNSILPERLNRLRHKPIRIDRSRLNIEDAFKRSEGIYVCAYKDYELRFPYQTTVTFFKPPVARFATIERIKGPDLGSDLPVRFEFHCRVGEPKPERWKFNEMMMPAAGSKWILFIPNCVAIEDQYQTYHGRYGIMEYTDENYGKLMNLVEKPVATGAAPGGAQ